MAKKKDTKKTKPKAKAKGAAATPVAELKPKGKGFKVKPVPDLSMREKFRESEPLKIGMSNRSHPGLNGSVLNDGLTPEQRAIKDAGRAAQDLLDEEDINGAIKSMVTFRRGYAVVYRAFQEMIERKKALAEEKGEPFNPMVEDFLIQYAMYESSKAFNEHQFMQGMIGVVMPFMAEIIDEHTKQEETVTNEERLASEERRSKRLVPIGFHHTSQQEEPYLVKDKTLVLTGWSNALLWLADNMVNHVLTAIRGSDDGGPFTVVRFMDKAPKSKDQQRYLIRVPGNAWKGCSDSQKKVAMCMGEFVADKLSAQPDLLVVDDLAHAYTLGFIGRPLAASAGDAQRNLRRWCDKAGCALVGFVPSDSMEPPDVTSPEWEQLRTFCLLRPVTILHEAEGLEPTKYRVVVGNFAAVFDVEKELLNNYGHGNIILPVGTELS